MPTFVAPRPGALLCSGINSTPHVSTPCGTPAACRGTLLHFRLVAAAQTLYCGNAVHNQLLQVTRASLRLVDAGTRELRREWRPPAGLSIDVAAASASQVRY